MYNQDKFPYDITVTITFQTDGEIQVKLLEIIFKKNEQKHYFLIISGNLFNFQFLGKLAMQTQENPNLGKVLAKI